MSEVTHPPYEPYPVSSHPSYPAPSDRDRRLPPPSKTQAGWALGLAIIPSVITWIVSVVFACSVISRSRDGRDHGKGMAVAALVIVGVWVAIAITVIAVLVATKAERDERGRVTDGGRSTIVGLHVGDCLPSPEANDEEQLAVQIVPCGEPHDAEVYANFDSTASGRPSLRSTRSAGPGASSDSLATSGSLRANLEVLYSSRSTSRRSTGTARWSASWSPPPPSLRARSVSPTRLHAQRRRSGRT